MDQQVLVDQWVDVDEQIKKLIRQKEALESALGLQDLEAGTKLDGRTKRVRVRDRAVLKGDRLEGAVTPTLWRRITKRVVVSDLLKAEIRRGKIDPDTVAKCSDRSSNWFETIV